MLTPKEDLSKHKIIPDPLKDQFFLTDESVLKKIIDFADLNKNDVVLEIGAGTGNLTFELAKKAGHVIAFEIDERFKPFLSRIPNNIDMRFENAWDYVQVHGKWRKKKEYNKIISNLPYSFIEPFLHNLTFTEYDKSLLLVPTKTVKMINENGIFASFFKAKILLEVPKERFFPIPKTNSVLLDLIKLPYPSETQDLGRFLRQYMYQHEDQLVKNSLMEGIIKYHKLVNKKVLTKNESRKLIADKKISENLLNSPPQNSEIYFLVEKKFNT